MVPKVKDYELLPKAQCILLVLVLANSVIKTEVPKLKDPFIRQGCRNTKIKLSGHNFQQLVFPNVVTVRSWLLGWSDMLSSKLPNPYFRVGVRTCSSPFRTPRVRYCF